MLKLLKKDENLFIVLATAFVILNAFAIAFEFFYLNALPFIFAVVWFALRSLDKFIFTIVFFTPLSIPLSEYVDAPIDMFIPTEPMLAGLLLLFIILLPTRKYIDKSIIAHPITIAIGIHLGWMFITTLTSTMPVISLKFFFMRLWFVIAFYYLMVFILKARPIRNIERLIWLYAAPMIFVIGYATYRHITEGIFNSKVAHWASNPFFKDHTIYGAILAFFIPVLVTFLFQPGKKHYYKSVTAIILSFFVVAVIASYSRAAWVSLVGAAFLFLILHFRIKFQHLAFFGAVVLVFLGLSWNQIMIQLEQNRQDSSVENISDHVQSISNISNDASNLERLNRWSAAFRMFADKPFFGFGPGTYMFQYAPYQMSYEKTIISTNAGDMGNAHSEYFGPLSEQGILGMLTFIAMAITIIWTGIKLFYRLQDSQLRLFVLGAVLGLFTYLLHALLNNFLDTDKASAPFWGMTAIIVAIDLYDRNKKDQKLEKLESK